MNASIIECHSEAEWLAERQKGIGASDAPVILGVSPWKTAYPLYAEKVGDAEPEDLSEVERIKWGNRLQRIVGDAYREETGRDVRHWMPYTVARSIAHEWMQCTPDAQQIAVCRPEGLLEIKTTNAFARSEWQDDPPIYYQVQLQHQLEVMGASWGTLCVLIGGQEMRWFDMERNGPFIDAMVEKESEFWERVEQRNPPPIDGTPGCAKALAKLHPEDSGEAVLLPEVAAEWDRRLTGIKESIKLLKERQTAFENQLKAAIGDNTYGILPNGGRYSWRTQIRKAHEVKESKSRILRRLNK